MEIKELIVAQCCDGAASQDASAAEHVKQEKLAMSQSQQTDLFGLLLVVFMLIMHAGFDTHEDTDKAA